MNNKVKAVAVVAGWLGVVVGGCLIAKDPESPAAKGWEAEPASTAPAYSGPDPEQADVLQDFESVTASAGLGPGVANAGVNPAGCVAGRNHLGPTNGTQQTELLNGLVEHGWQITRRRTDPVVVALSKGTWVLTVAPEPPSGPPVLSLIAIRDTAACEKQLAAR
ncbi:hypothetical protein [Streptomyces sp. NPDC092307]|uniref:hypothetical protein n=1 Tax=Streptomyces sp. NPDC092307 TaxID=3366013 RepID=UPI00382AB5B1